MRLIGFSVGDRYLSSRMMFAFVLVVLFCLISIFVQTAYLRLSIVFGTAELSLLPRFLENCHDSRLRCWNGSERCCPTILTISVLLGDFSSSVCNSCLWLQRDFLVEFLVHANNCWLSMQLGFYLTDNQSSFISLWRCLLLGVFHLFLGWIGLDFDEVFANCSIDLLIAVLGGKAHIPTILWIARRFLSEYCGCLEPVGLDCAIWGSRMGSTGFGWTFSPQFIPCPTAIRVWLFTRF